MTTFDLLQDLSSGVEKLFKAVSTTMGPKGKNVIIFDNEGNPYLTKDGVSVAKKVYSDDSIEDAAIKIVREASLKTAELAGDGTTTSVVLAHALFREGIDAIRLGYNPNTLKEGMMKAVPLIVEELKKRSTPIDCDFEKLKYIATVSANNDSTIGELVAKAYENAGLDGTVLFEQSESSKTYVENIDGSQFNVGYVSRDFITDKKKGIAEYSNACVLVYNGDIQTMAQVKDVVLQCSHKDIPLAIVANNFSDKALRAFVNNNYQGITKIVPIKVTGYTENKADVLANIAAATNAEIVLNNCTPNTSHLGKCTKIVVSYSDTTIIRDENLDQTKFNARVEILKGQVETNPTDALKRELSRLLGKVSIIYVGGSTEIEAREKYDRVEDAVCATRAALEEGIVEGGGITFRRIQNKLTTLKNLSKGEKVVIKCLSAPFECLCLNSGITDSSLLTFNINKKGINFTNNKVCDLSKEGIIDPTKVLRVSLENAVSAASMLLTTGYFVK